MKYIGITDFSSVEQVRDIKKLFSSSNQHVLMVGVMMSYKTLKGFPTKWTKAWPTHDELPGIFSEKDGVLNTLHFADYDMESTVTNWVEALRLCGPDVHAIQYDIPWPYQLGTIAFKETFPHIKTVLQIGSVALDRLGSQRAPKDVAHMIGLYKGSIDYALLDMSGGKGVPMDTTLLVSYIDEIKERHPTIGIAVAGGLGPTTMHLIDPLIDRYGDDFSIDAQGKLRKSGSALDPIDWSMAAEYVSKAIEMFT